MSKVRQQYSPEFKRAVVALVERGGKTMAEVEREHGLSKGLVKQWMRRYRESGAGVGGMAAVGELERLRQRNAQLEREVEVLKKAIAICSRG